MSGLPAARAAIIVVGSANQDYIVTVPAPPGPGETVLATSLLKQPGGKGANQAVAAARLRADVSFVGSVGDDADGAQLIRELRSEGVDTTNVEIISRNRTGLALVSVWDSGENSITVVPGTNFSLTSDRVRRTIERIATENTSRETIMVAQAEVLPDIITTAVTTAEATGARVILNLAPFQAVDDKLLAYCDPLVLNEAEASGLLGGEVRGAAKAKRAIRTLRRRARSVVVTVGAEGACWADATGTGHIPAPEGARVVDTTGAGDAFVGAPWPAGWHWATHWRRRSASVFRLGRSPSKVQELSLPTRPWPTSDSTRPAQSAAEPLNTRRSLMTGSSLWP